MHLNHYSLFMKKALFTLLLAAVPACFNAQRVFEQTNMSWQLPNLSVETHKDFVFAAFTDFDPATGRLSPVVKVTDVNANPLMSYFLDLPDDATLMDFTVRPATETLLFTGFLTYSPRVLFIVETDFAGNMIQSNLHFTSTGSSLVPHQIIHSENTGQVVIVGTEVDGILTPTNYTTVAKTGFILGLDLNNQNTVLFSSQTDSPGSGTFDHDMLESVTEVPTGYFITGSANEPGGFEQNLYVMGIDNTGATTHSNIWDNTNSHYAGSSVMYSAASNQVYLLANNSVIHQFQVTFCDPNTGAMLTNLFSHTPAGYPIGSGIDVNGFRLQESITGDIIIGGYITAWGTTYFPTIITPFQVTLDPTLNIALAFRLFQSDNNFNSGDYFKMVGNSVYINTPDIIAYNPHFDKTYLVNPNSNFGGYDLLVSHPIDELKCDKLVLTNSLIRTPINVGPASIPWLPMNSVLYTENPIGRNWKEDYLCKQKSGMLATNSQSGEVTIYPNPATDIITVTAESAIRSMKVLDLNGALVQTVEITSEVATEWTVSIAPLKAGVYLVEMIDSEGIISRQRFVKD